MNNTQGENVSSYLVYQKPSINSNLNQMSFRILHSIGLTRVCSYDIAACHRLKKNNNDRYPPKTIVRFVNRKNAEFCLYHRDRIIEQRRFLNMNLRIFESLCSKNEYILGQTKELKEAGYIHKYFIRNGFVKIIINEGDKPSLIKHPDFLKDQFQEFYQYKNLYQN